MNNFIEIPYIKIKQRDEIFYVSKLSASFLIKHIDMHFREPYKEYLSEESVIKLEDYINTINKKGIDLKSEPEGIQRRLQISRINDIKEYLESSVSNFFPNSILLSVDVSNMENFINEYSNYENSDVGFFKFPENVRFSVIDGQHRIAGLFQTKDERLQNDFELVVILLFNVSIPTAAKLFSDINGKQKPVNRSLIYDLHSYIDEGDFKEYRKFHKIAYKFYTDENSPLFRQIKMLGIGRGAISQAFFIDYAIDAIKKTDLSSKSDQEIYSQLFYYFRAFQKIFPDDWPVPISPMNYDDRDKYADKILKINKSQLVKTNGFGAIMKLFPEIYQRSDKTSEGYIQTIKKLHNNINWVQDPENPQGTGKQFQKYLMDKMSEVIFS
jgi:DGQHR domain-containing protein